MGNAKDEIPYVTHKRVRVTTILRKQNELLQQRTTEREKMKSSSRTMPPAAIHEANKFIFLNDNFIFQVSWMCLLHTMFSVPFGFFSVVFFIVFVLCVNAVNVDAIIISILPFSARSCCFNATACVLRIKTFVGFWITERARETMARMLQLSCLLFTSLYYVLVRFDHVSVCLPS